MAKLIPETIDTNIKSGAEKKLFPLFRDMPETDDWTVIHSVGIAKHIEQTEGESDFIIIIPGRGTFMLEVKGGTILYSEGEWYSRDIDGIEHCINDPRKEASGAMYSVIEYIKNHPDNNESLEKSLCGYGVVFPDTEVTENLLMPDLSREQIADMIDCIQPDHLKLYLIKLANYYKDRKNAGVFLPTAAQSVKIEKMLRPDFESQISLSAVIKNLDEQVINLTSNQQYVFDGLTENDRCLIKGSAGTGKTILAVNYAKTTADENLRTGVFCYNRRLADYIKRSLKGYENVTGGSFTDYGDLLAEEYYPDKASLQETNPDEYYSTVLPGLICDAFLEEKADQFDILIIDEAQDLMSPEYLDALDCSLKGGLEKGRWYFFADAEKQNLFHSKIKESDINGFLKERSPYYTKYTLSENCRNSLAIIEKLNEWFGAEMRSQITRDYPHPVGIKSYLNQSTEAKAVVSLIDDLLREGLSLSDIVILSPVKIESSCVREITEYRISDTDCKDAGIRFCTIQGFKGLESPAVIITDMENLKSYSLNLLYVGATRAKAALYVFANKRIHGKLTAGNVLKQE